MNDFLRHSTCTAALLAALLMTACGGGSDDDGTTPLKPAISEETARLRRMGLAEGGSWAAAAAPAEAASAAAR